MAEEQAAAQMAALKVEEDWAKERAAKNAPYFQRRIQLFEQFKARQTEALEAAKAANVPIKVVLPDGAGARRACRGSGWACGGSCMRLGAGARPAPTAALPAGGAVRFLATRRPLPGRWPCPRLCPAHCN